MWYYTLRIVVLLVTADILYNIISANVKKHKIGVFEKSEKGILLC
jgi:hypothetical protein